MKNETMKNKDEPSEIFSNEKLINVAFDKQIKVHLVLNDGSWRNGTVKEIKDDFFIFDDGKNGEEPFFFLQVKDVQPYLDKNKKGEAD